PSRDFSSVPRSTHWYYHRKRCASRQRLYPVFSGSATSGGWATAVRDGSQADFLRQADL
ncbi:hypothetical protein PENNAL_c0868G03109, partial [Penicillium nalgiovense]